MNAAPDHGTLTGPVLILKADKLCAEAVRRVVEQVLVRSSIQVVNRITDAKILIDENSIELFITGINLTDGDTLDLLSECAGNREKIQRLLVVTGHKEEQILTTLKDLPINGVFDQNSEGATRLATALRSVVEGIPYWSPSILDHLQQMRRSPNAVYRHLSPTEKVVFAIVGDGSEDVVAADRLGLKPSSIRSIRQALHRKLGVQHKGELIRLAVQHGFVRLRPDGVLRPGFARLLARIAARRAKKTKTAAARKAV